MPLTRFPNWDTVALHTFIQARSNVPFKWGVNDCSLFAADAVQAITGQDIAGDFRGKYKTEAAAFALITSVTGGTTAADAAAYCAAKFGLTEYEHPLLAQRGDLVVTENAGRVIAGVVNTDGRHIVSVGDNGLLYLPISGAMRAWKV